MKKTSIYLVALGFYVIGSTVIASAELTALRTIPYDEYWPNQRQVITIEVTGDPGPITVVETPPSGWTITGINPASGKIHDGAVIVWDIFSFDGTQTFKYKITPPADAEGEVVFSGRVGIEPIGGMSVQVPAVSKPLGIFDNHKDVLEDLEYPGGATYDPETGEYVIRGSGFMGHFVYTVLHGDFILKAKVRSENQAFEETTGMGVVDSIEETDTIGQFGSPAFYSIIIRRDTSQTVGEAKANWNTGEGGSGNYSSWTDPRKSDGRYILSRQGNTLSMFFFNTETQGWKLHHTTEIVFSDPVYVGFCAASITPSYYQSTAYYSDVELTVSNEEIRTVVEQDTTDAFNAHDLDRGFSHFTTDFVYDFTPQPEPMAGEVQVAPFFESMFQAFPDWHVVRNRVLVSGPIAVSESIVTGTHLSEWINIPATGNSVEVPVLHVWEFAGNKCRRVTEYLDMASIFIQLGVMPAPAWPPFELSFTPFEPSSPYLSPMDVAEVLISLWNSHDLLIFYELIRSDADIYMYPLGIPTDKNSFVASFQMYFDAFPDLRGDLFNLVDLGDGWVLGELVFSGTNDGEFLGNAPTGRYGELRGVNLWRFDEEGMVMNYYIYFDNITLLTQLGLFPPDNTPVKDWELY